MIVLPRHALGQITAAAEAAYPEECCGLLVGWKANKDEIVVSRIAVSTNVAEGDRRISFEVDPQVRIDLQRSLRDGIETLIGLYHSHPDHPATPSKRDAEQAWEPELIWMITAVDRGRATRTTAHRVEADGLFREIPIKIEQRTVV